MIEVRPVRPGDGAALHAMVRALAEDHKLTQYLTSTPQDLENELFRDNTVIGALLAFMAGEPAGCAIWHRSFSTFRGKPSFYLEDLSVLPRFRRQGVARALMEGLARVAVAQGVVSIYWFMMDWNDGGRAFYEGLKAEIEPGISFCRLTGGALEALGR
jgi:GNAT superfamily N-acetyltransferase